jgi:hypothetical protein
VLGVEVRAGHTGIVAEHGDRRMRPRIALDGVGRAVRGLDEVERHLAGQLEALDEMFDPVPDPRLVDVRVVDLERRRLATAVDAHGAVAHGGVGAVLAAGDEFLQDPRVVRGDGQ